MDYKIFNVRSLRDHSSVIAYTHGGCSRQLPGVFFTSRLLVLIHLVMCLERTCLYVWAGAIEINFIIMMAVVVNLV